MPAKPTIPALQMACQASRARRTADIQPHLAQIKELNDEVRSQRAQLCCHGMPVSVLQLSRPVRDRERQGVIAGTYLSSFSASKPCPVLSLCTRLLFIPSIQHRSGLPAVLKPRAAAGSGSAGAISACGFYPSQQRWRWRLLTCAGRPGSASAAAGSPSLPSTPPPFWPSLTFPVTA
jgi:hypothetical protein